MIVGILGSPKKFRLDHIEPMKWGCRGPFLHKRKIIKNGIIRDKNSREVFFVWHILENSFNWKGRSEFFLLISCLNAILVTHYLPLYIPFYCVLLPNFLLCTQESIVAPLTPKMLKNCICLVKIDNFSNTSLHISPENCPRTVGQTTCSVFFTFQPCVWCNGCRILSSLLLYFY